MTMLPADVSLVTEPQGAPPVSGLEKILKGSFRLHHADDGAASSDHLGRR